MSILKSHLSSYFGFGVVNKAIPFLGGLILAGWMSPSDYGAAGVFVSFVSILASFSNFSVSQQVVREREFLARKDFLSLIGTSRYFSLSILFLTLILTLIFSGWAEDLLELELPVLLVAIVLAYFRATCDFVDKLLVLEKRSKELGIVQSLGSIVMAVSSIVLVYLASQEQGLHARIVGISLGTLVWFLVGFHFFRKCGYSFGYVSYSDFLKILKYGVRVIPQLLSNWVKMGGDRIVLVSVLSANSMGAYVFLMMLVSAYSVFGNAVNNAYLPESMNLYKEKRVVRLGRLRRKYVLLLAVALIIGGLGLSSFKALDFWQTGYEVSYIAIWSAIAALFLQYIYMLYMKVFLYCDWMSKLGGANMLSVVCYVLLIYFFPCDITVEFASIFLFLYNLVMAVFVIMISRNYEKKVSESLVAVGDFTGTEIYSTEKGDSTL